MEKRKEIERQLHNDLRGDLASKPWYQSNKKFYSITRSNRDVVKRWFLKRCNGKKVLDYCCGNGDFTIWLAENGAKAYGIDISSVSIENAKRKADDIGMGEKVRFQVMDAEATDFPDDYFDFVGVNGVLHHLDLIKSYQELARILKPKGEIICTEALRHNIFIHSYRKMTPHLRSAWEVKHILGKKEIELAHHFFGRVETIKFFHLATIGAIPFQNLPGFGILLSLLETIDLFILKLPFMKWQAWQIVFVLSEPKIPVREA